MQLIKALAYIYNLLDYRFHVRDTHAVTFVPDTCLALIKSGFIFRFVPYGPLYELTAQLPETHSHKQQRIFEK